MRVYILAPTGDTVAFTVFEPATLSGGKTYPLVLHAPGFGATRTTTLGSPAPSPTQGANVGNNISELVAANYGVIDFDQRGFGQTTGKIRVMDPDFEGKDYLAILDWCQNKLPWLAFGPTLEGDDPHEPIMGGVGGSYGAMWQYMVLNIDKRHRLRALVPNASPADLNYSLFQNLVPKTTFDVLLFVTGTEGTSTGSMQRANFDPFVTETFTKDLAADHEDQSAIDFFGYHSADYWYDGKSFATNGGAGTMPLLPPTTKVPKVNAMVWQGVRDGLFNFTNGYNNYVGLKTGGGDVRLLSYQSGHNSLTGAPPDLGEMLYYPANDDTDSRCGSQLNEDVAQLDWFNYYLKGIAGAIDAIPTNPCISLGSGDAVTLPVVPTIRSGPAETTFTIPSTTVISGAVLDLPTAVSVYTAGASGNVEAGVPHIHLNIVPPVATGIGTPIVFVGVGQLHASNNAASDLVDNQVTPVSGTGTIDLDLIGGGTRLLPGDQLGLLFYGLQDQYAATGSVNVASPAVEALTITGTVSMPLVGSSATRL